MSRTILIVDDNEQERRIFSSFLRFVGASILEAGDGEEAIRMAREHLPDLVLMDLTIPVLDGWETLRRLRADPSTGWIPVIAVTARPLEPAAVEEAGFCGCLEKPIVPVRVMREVERCIGPLHLEPAPERAAPERPAPGLLAARPA